MRYRKIFWNIEACKDMYGLASTLDCPLVKVMVINRVIIMWKEERMQKEAHPQDRADEFPLPLGFLSTLTLEKDARFITMICEIYWGRLPLEQRGKWPTILSAEIIVHVEHVFAGRRGRRNGPRDALKEYCARQHIHSEDQPCHTVAGREHLAHTEDMIATIFAVLRSEASEKNVVQKSLEQEECIANVDFKIEMLEVKMYHRDIPSDDKSDAWKRREALVHRRNALQNEYYQHWDEVGGELQKMREVKQLETETKLVSSEDLPSCR
jgi:hypothetical protein